jgi:hypothetical protein
MVIMNNSQWLYIIIHKVIIVTIFITFTNDLIDYL